MKNGEKYKDEIFGISDDICEKFILPRILNPKGLKCRGMNCNKCRMIQMLWINEEYKEPEVDWTNVAVDTDILTSNDGKHWEKGHFATCKDGLVYSFRFGKTSWSSNENDGFERWKYAKLAGVEE